MPVKSNDLPIVDDINKLSAEANEELSNGKEADEEE